MRIGAIILKLRWEETSFQNYVGGATELNLALNHGNVQRDSMFVVPMKEDVRENEYDSVINQLMTENFSVIVCLINDYDQTDKLGIVSYERLHNVRDEIFKAILGWQIPDAESLISYNGGELLEIQPPYLWYKYNFSYKVKILQDSIVDVDVDEHTEKIFSISNEISKEQSGEESAGIYQDKTVEEILAEVPEKPTARAFEVIYMNLIQSPSRDLPWTGELPLPDNFPNVSLPNMANWIDMTKHPDDGGYYKSFGNGFNVYKG